MKKAKIFVLILGSVIYAIGINIYFMIIRSRWDIRARFMIPIIVGTVCFIIPLLISYISNRKNCEGMLPIKTVHVLIVIGSLLYGISTMLAGYTFLSQFPHYRAEGVIESILFVGIYPIQILSPFVLIRFSMRVLPIEEGIGKGARSFLKSCIDFANKLFLFGVLILIFLYIIVGFILPENAAKDGFIIFIATFEAIVLVGALPIIFSLISLSKACANGLISDKHLRKRGYYTRILFIMLYLIMLCIGNWLVLSIFSSSPWFYVFHTFNVVVPILYCMFAFFICEYSKTL